MIRGTSKQVSYLHLIAAPNAYYWEPKDLFFVVYGMNPHHNYIVVGGGGI